MTTDQPTDAWADKYPGAAWAPTLHGSASAERPAGPEIAEAAVSDRSGSRRAAVHHLALGPDEKAVLSVPADITSAEIAALWTQLDALRLYLQAFANVREPAPPRGPRRGSLGSRALAWFSARPGVDARAAQLVGAGVGENMDSMRTTLWRLEQAGELQRVSEGLYRLANAGEAVP